VRVVFDEAYIPVAAAEWRHRCGTEIEGGWVNSKREARQAGKRGRTIGGDFILRLSLLICPLRHLC